MKRFLAVLALAGCAAPLPDEQDGALAAVYRDTDVQIASKALFEPEKYLGRWYEIARFPVPFERDCAGVTTDYGRAADGGLTVLNTCRDLQGEVTAEIQGSLLCEATRMHRLRLHIHLEISACAFE